MTLELWNTLATFGTFLVIAATAIAAIFQLRHARTSNQIAAINELRESMETPAFAAAQHFVFTELADALKDPELRHQLFNRNARTSANQTMISKINTVGNHYEGVGLLIRAGLVDKRSVLEMWSGPCVGSWEALSPATAIFRRQFGSLLWENFEYLAVLSQDWIADHPHGTYPPGMRRLSPEDEWLDADTRYAASLKAR
ncbi:MAG TPA: hypothetical protein VIN40_05355 [Candidatus Tyrphobacter sp.]